MGLATASPEAIERWRDDLHSYQVYQYDSRNMMTNKEGDVRLPSVREREVVMGFDEGYTSAALPPKCSKSNEEMVLCSVLRNSFHVFSVSFLITELLKECYGKDFDLTLARFVGLGYQMTYGNHDTSLVMVSITTPSMARNLYSSILGERSEEVQTLDWTRRSLFVQRHGPDRAFEATFGNGK